MFGDGRCTPGRYINASGEFTRSITELTRVKEYLIHVNSKFYNPKTAWNILLLLIRIWLGYRMFTAGYSSVMDIIFHPKERVFFEDWKRIALSYARCYGIYSKRSRSERRSVCIYWPFYQGSSFRNCVYHVGSNSCGQPWRKFCY